MRSLPALVLPLCLAAQIAGCTASLPPGRPPEDGVVTVFVPGYKGSALAAENGDRAWLTVGQALASGTVSLALPFPGAQPQKRVGPLHEEGPLTRLTILPGVARQDVYLPFLEFGRDRLPGFVSFGYDWRQDLRQSGAALCARLDAFAARGLRVRLVAHSMGGLVAQQCLRSQSPGAAAVDRVAFLGTPFQGSALIFQDLLRGTRTGRNRELLSVEALFTFASAFQLLPARSDFFRTPQGSNAILDVFEPQTWIARGWGVFADPPRRTDPAYRAQLQRMLDAHDTLARDDRPLAHPVLALAVAGRGRGTFAGLRVVGGGKNGAGGAVDLDHPLEADGDGVVLRSSAEPAFPHQMLESGEDHLGLLTDPAVEDALVRFLSAPPRS